MARPLKSKDFIRLMNKAGCRIEGRTNHSMVFCGCGEHKITVCVGHGEVSPQVVRDVKSKMPCVSVF